MGRVWGHCLGGELLLLLLLLLLLSLILLLLLSLMLLLLLKRLYLLQRGLLTGIHLVHLGDLVLLYHRSNLLLLLKP